MFVKLSLLWFFWVLVSVDDVELLVELSMFGVNHDVLVFTINTSLDVKDLSSFIHNEGSFKSEELPPSRVDT